MAGMERFTQRARRVLSLAHQEAERMRHTAINTEHILLGLIEEEGGIAGHALRELGLENARVQEMVERLAPIGREESPALELSVGAQQVLEYAIEEARLLGHQFVGTEHLLLGLTRSTEGMALEVLRKLGVTPEQVRRQTRRVMEDSASGPTSAGHAPLARRDEKKEAKTPLVDQLAVDLTVLAEEGKLDPVIGRQQEIERVIQILARRNKNNPALIGEPGVGKTAIVEGLAQRIIEGDVPAPLIGKKVLQLDVGSLVAGTMYRGQFEERLKRVIDPLDLAIGDGFMREEIPALFGEEFNPGSWNSGHVVLKRQNAHVLLVTLNKQGKAADHRYVDHWIDENTFHWQSQNSTSPSSKRGRELIEHHKDGRTIHLFVRENKLASGKAAPFIYFGPVNYVRHNGSEPMSVIFELSN